MPLYIIRQDITKMQCDAIVNSTNINMVGYSGLDAAIHEAAGPELDAECEKIRPLGLGCAKITGAYNLPAKYIIHTSGPIWQGGFCGESIILKSCYRECLKLAKYYDCSTVAFPLISSGAYGYPKDQVLQFAVKIISEFLYYHEMTVYLCVFDRTSYEFSKTLYNDIQDFVSSELPEDKKADVPDIPPRSRRDYITSARRVLNADGEYVESVRRYSSLRSYLDDMDKPFIYTLFYYIDKKGMTDVECYKKANVDRKTFSKLRTNPNQQPSKQTAVAFAIALELTFDETQHLLSTAGMTLSRSNVFDKIIRYFIKKGNYNIHEINEALFEFDQTLLGSV